MSEASTAKVRSEGSWRGFEDYVRDAVDEMRRQGWTRLDSHERHVRSRLAPMVQVAAAVDARVEFKDTSPADHPGGDSAAYRVTFEGRQPLVLPDQQAYNDWMLANMDMLKARAMRTALSEVSEAPSASPAPFGTRKPTRRAL